MKRKITVILAADVVGFSRMVAEDEEETLRRLGSYRDVFSDFIKRANGRIFNTAGDAILAEFPSAVDAVRCAVDVQESIRTRNLAYAQSRHMNFRIGITIGDVVERDGDLLGDGVNIAARLESVAPPGGVCVSRSVHEAVANKMSVKFADMGERQLKNIPEPVHAYSYGSEANAPPPAKKSGFDLGSLRKLKIPDARAFRSRNALLAVIAVVAVGGTALSYLALEPLEEDTSTVAEETEGTAVPESQDKATVEAPEPSDVEKVAASKTADEKAVAPSEPDKTPAEKAEPPASKAKAESEPAPRKSLDPLAMAMLLPRQMRECREGTVQQALTACQAIVDNRLVTGSELATVSLKLGKSLREAGETDRALAAFTEAIEADPSADAYNNRGIVHYQKGDKERAIADYTEAVRLNPQHGEALNNRAWTYYKSGQMQAALSDADRAVRLLPGEAYTWDTRGHINESLSNRDAAIRDYRKALSLDPKSASSTKGLERLGASR